MTSGITRKAAGFSLIELMITVTILAIISGSILVVFRQHQQRYQAETQYAQAVQNARATLDVISRSLRQAGNNPSSAAFNALTYTAGVLTIASDVTGSTAAENPLDSTGDPDSLLTAAYELMTVRFDSSAHTILLDSGSGETVLAENISNLQFTFFDETGAETLDAGNANSVKVTLEALSEGKDPQARKANAITLSTRVFLRSKVFSPFQ